MDELLRATNKKGKVTANVVNQLLKSAEQASFACKMLVTIFTAEQHKYSG